MNFSEAYNYTILSIQPIFGKDESKAISRLLFMEKYNVSLPAFNNQPFYFETELNLIIKRLLLAEPIQYILGYTYFQNLKIAVNPNVLIPRPETEELVALAIPYIHSTTSTVADICTGSGCIALSIRSMFKNNYLIASDISEGALEIASENEYSIFNERTIQYEKHDILTKKWPFKIPDIVISNPPYIARDEANRMEAHVLEYEPHLALFVEDDDALLFYKSIIQTFLPFVFPKIFFEINPLVCNDLINYCKQYALHCEITKDMQGMERFAIISQL